jgi:large subunit ribosomal protein L22
MTDVRAFQRTTRQSPYKMRLVIDQIRGKDVNEALALLRFSKKHAAHQIEKVLNSAVANAEYKGRESNEPVDVDTLYVKHAIINEGPKLKRFTPAAMGRATPIQKRTSHVEIVLGPRAVRVKPRPKPAPAGAGAAKGGSTRGGAKAGAKGGAKTTAKGGEKAKGADKTAAARPGTRTKGA